MLVRRTNKLSDFTPLQHCLSGAFARDWGRFLEPLDVPTDAPVWAPALDVIEQEDQILLVKYFYKPIFQKMKLFYL